MKQFMILSAFLLMGISTFAQDDRPYREHPRKEMRQGKKGKKISHEERAEKMLKRLDEKLNLSNQQEQKIKAIFAEANTQIKALETNNKPQMEAMRAELKAAREKANGDREVMREEMKAIKSKYKGSLGSMKKDIHKIKASSKAKIARVLTEEQLTEFFMLEDRKGHKPPPPQKRMGKKRGRK